MPWSRQQIRAIAASYEKRGKKIPAKVRKEMSFYWDYPSKGK